MQISKKELKESIKSLVAEQKADLVIDFLLEELTELQLQDVIKTILDPEYKSKQAILADPKRFISKGELAEVNKTSVDVRVEAGV